MSWTGLVQGRAKRAPTTSSRECAISCLASDAEIGPWAANGMESMGGYHAGHAPRAVSTQSRRQPDLGNV